MAAARKRLMLTETASHNALLRLHTTPEEEEEEEEEEEYLLVEEDTTDSSLVITMDERQRQGKGRGLNRKRKLADSESEEELEPELEIDRQLDQSLESKSKQHRLTKVNVKTILHEVITNEHVVAMMKAALNETKATPPFEPKMTRSKYKEVVEKGVVIPAWNISPIKKVSELKARQFMDIPLAEEDSSDEEYRPEEEEEDETAEDTFQESDMESSASSPRGSRVHDACSPWQHSRARSRYSGAGSASMAPPPPPQTPPLNCVTDSCFLEKLHAVEEELSQVYRTRSNFPLGHVPLGRLEAELRAPDITADMYDSGHAHQDREWTDWLRGLMSSDVENEEECDDEDDPEYNFLSEVDEPDREDYRDDRAVRITKKEVNQLMEELFETLKEDGDDEGHEEEEQQEKTTQDPEEAESGDQVVRELRTVRQQLDALRARSQRATPPGKLTTPPRIEEPLTLQLSAKQREQLTQHLQQHVQLLLQLHLLCLTVSELQLESQLTRTFLCELDMLAQRAELVASCGSAFRASNLQGALQLVDELRQAPISHRPRLRPPDALGRVRGHPLLPAQLAWLLATRSVFLYPELLPRVHLDPALYCPRRSSCFTAAEDCLVVLGLLHMEGAADPVRLMSHFLLRKSVKQLRRRIQLCCRGGVPPNIIKAFRCQGVVCSMPVACRRVQPGDLRPPVERDERLLPPWLAGSLPVIYPTIKQFNAPQPIVSTTYSRRKLMRTNRKCSFPAGTRYPPRLPDSLDFQRIGFVLVQSPTGAAGTPGRTAAGTSCRAPAGTPAETPAGSLGRTPGRIPAGTPTETPSRTPAYACAADKTSDQTCFDSSNTHNSALGVTEDDATSFVRNHSQSDDRDQEAELFLYLSDSSLSPTGSATGGASDDEEGRTVPQLQAAEQQQFERSRHFLLSLGRSLGESSSHFQEVMSVLQEGHAPGSDVLNKISSLLRNHFHLQQEFWEFFGELQRLQSPDRKCVPHSPPSGVRQPCSQSERGRGEEGGAERENPQNGCRCWTREADHAILTFCRQEGANQTTFHQLAVQLGNRTANQVRHRFQELMRIFRSASQNSTSCPAASRQLGSQGAVRT